MSYKIAVMGSSDTVTCFKALGFDCYAVDSSAQAEEIFSKISLPEAGYAIVYMEESYAQSLSDAVVRFKDDPTLAVIPIPGREGSLGYGRTALASAVEKAIGFNITGD